jgi:deoxyadenosine/deoxycytidine kinase
MTSRIRKRIRNIFFHEIMIISIDGNIGSGKSTIMDAVSKNPRIDAEFFPEPLHIWGETLQKYFDDKKTWACPLTIDILAAFDQVRQSTRTHQIVERSPLACLDVFTEILKHDGMLTKDELNVIDEYASVFKWIPDVILYIDVDPLTCQERMRSRNRHGEDVPYDELRAIEYRYKKVLERASCRVHIVKQSDSESIDAFHARISLCIQNILSGDSKATITP